MLHPRRQWLRQVLVAQVLGVRLRDGRTVQCLLLLGLAEVQNSFRVPKDDLGRFRYFTATEPERADGRHRTISCSKPRRGQGVTGFYRRGPAYEYRHAGTSPRDAQLRNRHRETSAIRAFRTIEPA